MWYIWTELFSCLCSHGDRNAVSFPVAFQSAWSMQLPEVRNARGGADPRARMHHQVLGVSHELGQFLHFAPQFLRAVEHLRGQQEHAYSLDLGSLDNLQTRSSTAIWGTCFVLLSLAAPNNRPKMQLLWPCLLATYQLLFCFFHVSSVRNSTTQFPSKGLNSRVCQYQANEATLVATKLLTHCWTCMTTRLKQAFQTAN